MGSSSLSFLLRREEVPLSKLQNLIQVTDDDLAGHLDQERPQLARELAQRKRRAFGLVVPSGRTGVTVDEAVPLDDQPGELRAAGRRTLRGAFFRSVAVAAVPRRSASASQRMVNKAATESSAAA
jgi:hypothetical protein